MIKPIIAIFVFCFSFLSWASSQVDLEARLRSHIDVLTQEAWKGRKAGTEGGKLSREWIISQFKEIGIHPLIGPSYEQPIYRWVIGDELGVNILGFLGPSPQNAESCILLGAHYDALGEDGDELFLGANDNASGVAVLLEIARNLREKEADLKKCIVFAAWDYEEGSLRTVGGVKGSQYFVDHPPISLEKIELAVAFDLLGGRFFEGSQGLLFSFGVERSSTLRRLHKNTPKPQGLNPITFSTEILEPLGSVIPRSDYGPFRNAGISHLFFTTGTPSEYHRVTDTKEKIDFHTMVKVANYLTSYFSPLALGQTSVKKNETPKLMYGTDIANASHIISQMLHYRAANKINSEQALLLQEDIQRLHTNYKWRKSDFPVCWLQITFMDILQTLEVRGASSFMIDFFTFRCSLL